MKKRVPTRVLGVDKVLKNMKRVHEKIKEEALKELHETALEVETDAKMRLTKEGHVDTGRLRASIHTSAKEKSNYKFKAFKRSQKSGNKNSETLVYRGELESVKLRKNELYTGTNVVYAKKIENG